MQLSHCSVVVALGTHFFSSLESFDLLFRPFSMAILGTQSKSPCTRLICHNVFLLSGRITLHFTLCVVWACPLSTIVDYWGVVF